MYLLWVRWRESYKRQELLSFPEHPGLHPRLFVRSVLLLFLVFNVVLCFLFCLSSSCVLCDQCCQCTSPDCSFLSVPSVLSNVYSEPYLPSPAPHHASLIMEVYVPLSNLGIIIALYHLKSILLIISLKSIWKLFTW